MMILLSVSGFIGRLSFSYFSELMGRRNAGGLPHDTDAPAERLREHGVRVRASGIVGKQQTSSSQMCADPRRIVGCEAAQLTPYVVVE